MKRATIPSSEAKDHRRPKVQNPLTGRLIDVDGPLFKRLCVHEHGTYDKETNTLHLPKPNNNNSSIFAVDSEEKEPSHKTTRLTSVVPPITLLEGCPDFTTLAHISDVHVPSNLFIARRVEYETVFGNLYVKLRELAKNTTLGIVVTGDLVHTKLDVQNETNFVARNFLYALGQIAPTIVIIGNHDFLEHNHERIDSLTIIVDRLPNVFGLKHTGLYKLGGILFSFSSLFDNQFIPSVLAAEHNKLENLPMFKLFHGTVKGSMNCNGRTNVSAHGMYDLLNVDDFMGYDAVLMGHIHKQQKLRIPDGKEMWYAGSLIQQNFGEVVENHGILLWNVKTKSGIPFDIKNNFAMLNIQVQKGELAETSRLLLLEHAKKTLSLKCYCKNTTSIQFDKLKADWRLQFTLQSIRLAAPLTHSTASNLSQVMMIPPSVASSTTQLQLDLSLLQQHTTFVDAKKIEQLLDFHQLVLTKIKNNTSALETLENQTIAFWNPIKMRFCNVLRYGEDHINEINFTNGVFNLSARNKGGKTSLLCIFLFGLFGKIAKTDSPQRNEILHNGTKRGFIEITFVHDAHVYRIHRDLQKQRAGATKVNVRFCRVDDQNEKKDNQDDVVDLCGGDSDDVIECKVQPDTTLLLNDGPKTQAQINKLIGEFEPFVLLHVVSSHFSEPLLHMTAGEKYKQLLQLCQIDQYAEYYSECAKNFLNPANEESKFIEGQLKTFVGQQSLASMVQENNVSEELLQKTRDDLVMKRHAYELANSDITAITVKTSVVQEKLNSLADKSQAWQVLSSNNEEEEEEVKNTTPLITEYNMNPLQDVAKKCKELRTTIYNLTNIAEQQLDQPMVLLSTVDLQVKITKSTQKQNLLKKPELDRVILFNRYHETKAQLSNINNDNNNDDMCIESYEAYLSTRKHHLVQQQSSIVAFLEQIKAQQKQIEMTDLNKQDETVSTTTTIIQQLRENVLCLETQVAETTLMNSSTLLRNNLNALRWNAVGFATNMSQTLVKQTLQFVTDVTTGVYSGCLAKDQGAQEAKKRLQTYVKLQNERTEFEDMLTTIHINVRLELLKVTRDLKWYTSNTKLTKLKNLLQHRETISHTQKELLLCEVEAHTLLCSAHVYLQSLFGQLRDKKQQLYTLQKSCFELEQICAKMEQRLASAKTLSLDQAIVLEKKQEVENRVAIYKEYLRLVDKPGIPFVLLQAKMEQFKERVNKIFHEYTEYHFDLKYEHKKTGSGIRFDITHRNTNANMEPGRLCGFESVILLLAINYAALTLSMRSQCGFLLVDEVFDCIDQESFAEDLPEILEAIKPFYQTLMIISHREIPHAAIDFRLKIQIHGKFNSSINA